MDQYTELDEMRSQIALLKEKLDKETIVNDSLLRDMMRQKMNVINRNAWIESISCLFVITYGSYVFYNITHSVSFVIGTILYMLTCTGATLFIHRKVRKGDVSGDLLTVAKNMKYVKRQYHNWLYFAFPSVILWLAWFFWEAYLNCDEKIQLFMILVAACLFGAVIGGCIGWFIRRKVISTCDEIIRQIEEI